MVSSSSVGISIRAATFWLPLVAAVRMFATCVKHSNSGSVGRQTVSRSSQSPARRSRPLSPYVSHSLCVAILSDSPTHWPLFSLSRSILATVVADTLFVSLSPLTAPISSTRSQDGKFTSWGSTCRLWFAAPSLVSKAQKPVTSETVVCVVNALLPRLHFHLL